MRNLKRALSLAMATFMLLGMMVVGAGAVSISDFSDGEKIVNQEAVTVLTTLNVLNGRDDGSYDPEGVVNRAEMAKMICVVLNGGRTPQLGTSGSTFTDVAGTNAAWAEPFIAYCANLGIIAGYGDGTFKPTATVTAAEASKMLLVALGYKADVEGYVGADWQINVDVAANQNNLYNGLATLNTNDGLSRDNAAQMVFNALNAQMVAYTYVITGTADNSITTKPQITTENLSTLLVEKFKADKLEAVVLSNDTAALDNNYSAADDAGETTLAIVSANGKTLDNPFVDTYKVATTEEMLGQRVALYVKNNTNTVGYDADNTIVIGTPIVVNRNKVIESTDGTKSGKLAGDNNLSIDSNTQYFVNYGGFYGGLLYGNDPAEASTVAADVDNTVKTMTQAQFDAEAELTGVSVKLIDNDGDKKVDYAMAVKYSYGSVNKYSTTDDGALRIQGLFNEDEYEAADVVGFDDVAKDDFVLFTEYGGRIYVQKPETMEGKLENYSTSKKNVKLDGETIDWSGLNGTRFNEIQYINDYVLESGVLNTSAVYYKDINGYIFGVAETDESLLTYAVLMGFENQTSAATGKLGTEAKARLLFADGTQKTIEVSTIDGKKVTNCTGTSGVVPNTYAVPLNSSQIGFGDVDQFNVYSYSLNENGTVKLSSKSANMVNKTNSQTDVANQSATVSYAKGASTISMGGTNGNYTVTDKTVFLYSKEDGSVARFQGRTSPSIENTKTTQISVRVSGRGEALVVFLNDKNPSADFKDNFAYVYNTKVSQNGDAFEVKAIIDGKIETYLVDNAYNASGADTIKPDQGTGKHTIAVGLYNYSKDGNIYTLTQKNVTVNSTNGTVTNVTGGYIRVSNTSYTVTADTKFLESRTDKTAGENASVSNNDSVSVVYDDDMKAIYVFLTKFSYEGGSTPSGGNTVVDGSGVVGTLMSANSTVKQISDELQKNNVIVDGAFSDIAADVLNIPSDKTLVIKGNLATNDAMANVGTVIVEGIYTAPAGAITGTVKARGLTLSGATTIGGDVTVVGTVTQGSHPLTVADTRTLTVVGNITGTGTINSIGKLDVTGNVTTTVILVDKEAKVTGDVTAKVQVGGANSATVNITGNLTGLVVLNKGTLSVGGNLNTAGTITVDASKTLVVDGDYTQDVGGSLTINGDATVTVGKKLTLVASGLTLNKGALNVKGDMAASSVAILVGTDKALSVGGTLSTTGTVTIDNGKTLTVGKDLTGSDNITVTDGTLNVGGDVIPTANKTVTVTKGDMTVGGVLTTGSGNIAVGHASSTANLTVAGLTTTTGTFTVTNGAANMTGVAGAVTVTKGSFTSNGNVTTITDVVAGQTAEIIGNVATVTDNNGTLTITGNVTTKIATVTAGTLTVTGDVALIDTAAGTVNITGTVANITTLASGANVTVNGTLTKLTNMANGVLTVNGNIGTLTAQAGGTLNLNGKATATGASAATTLANVNVIADGVLTLVGDTAAVTVTALTGEYGGRVVIDWVDANIAIPGSALTKGGATVSTPITAATFDGTYTYMGSTFDMP